MSFHNTYRRKYTPHPVMEVLDDDRVIIYIRDTPSPLPPRQRSPIPSSLPSRAYVPSDDELNVGMQRKIAPATSIPSRAFQTLQRMTGESDGGSARSSPIPPLTNPNYINEYYTPPRSTPKKVATTTIPIGTSGIQIPAHQQPAGPEPKKYSGGSIPSRSFKVLQAMTGPEQNNGGTYYYSDGASSHGGDSTGDRETPEPRMYMGGHIPSKSFRLLQAMTGSDGISDF